MAAAPPSPLTLLAKIESTRCDDGWRQAGQVVASSALGAGRNCSKVSLQVGQKYSYSGMIVNPLYLAGGRLMIGKKATRGV